MAKAQSPLDLRRELGIDRRWRKGVRVQKCRGEGQDREGPCM